MKKVKKTKSPRMIKDVTTNWRQMHGANSLEKRLNAFLTSYFITSEAPQDECLKLAKKIASLKNPTKNKVYKILYDSLGRGVMFDESGENKGMVDLAKLIPSVETSLQNGSQFIIYLLKLCR